MGPSIMGTAAVRSASRERLVQSQILCLPPGSSSGGGNTSRDSRDAWDYYGPPPGTTSSPSSASPSSHQALNNGMSPKVVMGQVPGAYGGRPGAAGAPGGSSIINSSAGRPTQSPGCNNMPQQQHQLLHSNNAGAMQQQQRSNNGAGQLRDPRLSLLSPPKMDGTASPGLHAPSPQRIFNPLQCHPQQQQQQHQRAQPQQPLLQHHPQQLQPIQQQQQHGQQQGGPVIHHLQYPHYNAKLESLTHRMPNLSFEGLGHQPSANRMDSIHGQLSPAIASPPSPSAPAENKSEPSHQFGSQHSTPSGETANESGAISPAAGQEEAEMAGAGPGTRGSPVGEVSSSSTNEAANDNETIKSSIFSLQRQPDGSSDASSEQQPPPQVASSQAEQLVQTGQHHHKDLLSAEASCLFRLADPSMMLVRDEAEGGSNSSTSTRSAAAKEEAAGDEGAGAPESATDCGSLSKSSSDGGDPVGAAMSSQRKRPPTKLKSRRRNILSFPHHISVDELRLIQVSYLFNLRIISFSCES